MDPIIPQPETAITPEPHKHFLNKKFAITFIILCYWGGAYAGIWYWQKINNSVCYDCGRPPPDITYKNVFKKPVRVFDCVIGELERIHCLRIANGKGEMWRREMLQPLGH